jgi:hypothetical protein
MCQNNYIDAEILSSIYLDSVLDNARCAYSYKVIKSDEF